MKHHHFNAARRPIWLSIAIIPIGVLYLIAMLSVSAVVLLCKLFAKAGLFGSVTLIFGFGIICFAIKLAWANRHNL